MSYEIVRHQPCKRVSWRIYKDGVYVQTYTYRKDAIRFIEKRIAGGK